ncbi:patatin-like phospholipase family protein, partial [bacterium]|nr:patatin-like phospholipase family protein [bacterium]
MTRPFRILSIDGGGVKGIIPAMVLHELEQISKRPVAELFDLVIGTSTGGILALGLTAPQDGDGKHRIYKPRYSAADMVRFYQEECVGIFSD